MSSTKYRVEVQTAGSGDSWAGNALMFDTEGKAEAYAQDLAMRWTQVKAWRVVKTDESGYGK